MKKSKIILHSFLNSLGVFVYVLLVALLIFNGEKFFGTVQNFWGPVGFLLLFVVSAGVVGLLIFGQPIRLFMEGFKSEAFILSIYTVLWLMAYTLVVLVAMVLV